VSNPNDPVGDNAQQWWLAVQGGEPTGPHNEGFILAGIKTGAISQQTVACPVGSQEWRKLIGWPAFAAICPATSQDTPFVPATKADNAAPAFERLPKLIIIAVVFLLIVNVVIFSFSLFGGGLTGELAETQKAVTMADGRFSITLTSGWSESPQLAPGSLYCAKHSNHDLVLVVFAEDKNSLLNAMPDGGVDLEKYGKLLREMLRRSLVTASEEPTERTMIAGYQAIQAVVRGSENGTQLVFLHTVLDTPSTFYQVRIFTTADRFASQRGEIQRITASFCPIR
jgi:hypothetical protein